MTLQAGKTGRDAKPSGSEPAPGDAQDPPIAFGGDYIPGNSVEPLIEGAATYKALETAIEGAKKSVHMAYWTFQVEAPVHAPDGSRDWGQLICSTAEKGVDVCVNLADFDPILAAKYHLESWSNWRKLMEMRANLDPKARTRLHVMCSQHNARVGSAVRILGQPMLRQHLGKLLDDANGIAAQNGGDFGETKLKDLPGVWPFIEIADGKAEIKTFAFPTGYPAAHHEKLCVIDDDTVFLGGLDVSERRADETDHDNPFPWHDIACRLQGPAAGLFAVHFRKRWNEERGEYLRFLAACKPPDGVPPLPRGGEVPPLDETIDAGTSLRGDIDVLPMRTMSLQAKSSFSRSPRKNICEIERGYLDLIASAEHFIYIENQYLRSRTIANALIERHAAAPGVEVMIVLPYLPEEAFTDDDPDIGMRFGQYLQSEVVGELKEALGNRIAFFSFARDLKFPTLAPDEDADHDGVPDVPDVRSVIYVHAKTMVVDDRAAIIGSANLNDRSMHGDTETAIAWRGGTHVRDYRVALWEHALGQDTSGWTGPHLQRWIGIARTNARSAAEKRSGFAVPLPEVAIKAFRESSLVVTPELV